MLGEVGKKVEVEYSTSNGPCDFQKEILVDDWKSKKMFFPTTHSRVLLLLDLPLEVKIMNKRFLLILLIE